MAAPRETMNWLRGHAGLLCLLGAALGACHTPVASIHVGVLQAVTAPDNLATGIIRTLKERPPTNVNVLHLKADSADEDDLAESARRMVAEEVDLIIALTRPAALAAQRHAAPAGVPVVFVAVPNPVDAGLVETLAHPGGLVTGVMSPAGRMAGRMVEVLTQAVPDLARLLVVFRPNGATPESLADYEAAADHFGLELVLVPLTNGAMARAFFRDVPRGEYDAVIELSNHDTTADGSVALADLPGAIEGLIALSRRDSIPVMSMGAVGPARTMAFAVEPSEWRDRTATLAMKVLSGIPPVDLPVEFPRRVQFALFPRRAEAIGYEFSPEALSIADRVIPNMK